MTHTLFSMSVLETLVITETYDICDILFGIPDEVTDQDIPYTPVEWLEKLDKQLKSDDPLCTKGDNNVDMVIPSLLGILRECISTHRWSQSVPVIQQLSKHDLAVFWKTSMEVMYTSESSQQLVQQLVKELKLVKHLNCQEVLMEYLMFLLHQSKLDDAKQVSQDVRKRRSDPSPKDKNTDILFKAYQSLVWYVEWAASKAKLDEMDDTNELVYNYEEIMATYAQKAIIGFKQIVGEAGVWDIFIIKHVEMLEYYDKTEEAKDILTQYRDRNTENLNAHKYLYQFCVRNEGSKEEELKLLMMSDLCTDSLCPPADMLQEISLNIAEACPSDSLVLQLCTNLVTDGKVALALRYLFTLLDYSCWQNEMKPWKQSLDLIEGSMERVDVRSAVQDSWKMRESWWPQYHFHSDSCPIRGEECELCYCKAKLAMHVIGKGFQKIFKNFNHLSAKQIKNLKEDFRVS